MVLTLSIVFTVLTQSPAATHDGNAVYRAAVSEGLVVEGTAVKLPEPLLGDGAAVEAEREALAKVAGSPRAVEELLRDSVSAPFILKMRDVKAGESIVRVADLWFAVRAELDQIDPNQAVQTKPDQPVEAGNMRFQSRLLKPEELAAKSIPSPEPGQWYVHIAGRLLDRITVDATDQVVATRTADSLLVASRTDPRFGRDGDLGNHWATLVRQGSTEQAGPAQAYPGGISYVKLTRLKSRPGLMFVEAHFAFVEPKPWFDGAPILRSKISLVAQDQIRRLRREIAKKQAR